MLHLTGLTPVLSQMTGPPAEMAAARDLLTYYAKGFQRDPRYRNGIWDGQAVAMTADGRFLAGLENYLISALSNRGIQVERTGFHPNSAELGPRIRVGWNDADPGPLRPYQQEALAACHQGKRGVVWMATGTGKTEVFSRLIYELAQPTLVLVHTVDLLHQTMARLAARLQLKPDQIGQVGGGTYRWRPVTVAMIQTLASNLPELLEHIQQVKLLIVDESHHVPASTWQQVMCACPAPYRIAFSATPYTDNHRDWQNGVPRAYIRERFLLLTGATGPLLYKYAGDIAEADGAILRPHVYILTVGATRLELPPEPWVEVQRYGIVRCAERNQITAQLAAHSLRGGRHGIVSVSQIAHVDLLNKMIRGAVPGDLQRYVVNLTSDHRGQTRRDTLAEFKQSPRGILIGTSLLDEALDIPSVSMLWLAAGGKAPHRLQQRIGRGQRLGSADLMVFDYDDRHHPTLRRHALERQHYYQEQGWPVDHVGVVAA